MVCKRPYEEDKKTSSVCLKIFAKQISDKGHISWIYKEISKPNNEKPKFQLENRQKTWRDILPKRIYRWQNRHLKRCSTSLPTGPLQTKTTTKYHCTPIRMAKIKKIPPPPNAGQDVDKRDHPDIAGGNVNWCAHSGKQLCSFL